MLLYTRPQEKPAPPPDVQAKTWKVLKVENTPAYAVMGYGYHHTAFRAASINADGSLVAATLYPTSKLALRNAAGMMTYLDFPYAPWAVQVNKAGDRLVAIDVVAGVTYCYAVENAGTSVRKLWSFARAQTNDVSVTDTHVYVLSYSGSVKLDWAGNKVKELADTAGRTIAANGRFVAIGSEANTRLYDTDFNLVATSLTAASVLHLAKDYDRVYIGYNVYGGYDGIVQTATVSAAGFGPLAICRPLSSSGWSELGFSVDSTYWGNVMLTASKECEYVTGLGTNHGDIQAWLFDGSKFNLESRFAEGLTNTGLALGTGVAVAGNGTLAVARRTNALVFIVPNV